LILIGFWYALRWYFYASVGEKIQKEMSLLSALTCVHHPMSLSRTSGIRNVTNLCVLACDLEFMIISIEIVRKCLFNKSFPFFLFPLVLSEKFKSLICPRSAHREWFDYFQAYSWCIPDLYSIACVCAAGKISRVSTLDFAAETWSFVILCVIVFCLSVLRY